MTQEVLINVPETARRLSTGRSTVYDVVRLGISATGTIRSIRRVPVTALERLAETHAA